MSDTPQVTSVTRASRRAIGPIVLATLLLLITGYMTYESLGFPFRVRLGPMVFSGTTFLLSVVVLLAEVRTLRGGPASSAVPRAVQEPATESGAGAIDADVEPAEDETDDRLTRSEFVAFGWIGGVIVAFFGLGFVVGMPVFMLALMRLHGKETWRLSIAVTAGVMLVVYLLFVQVLNVPTYPGVVPRYLGFGG